VYNDGPTGTSRTVRGGGFKDKAWADVDNSYCFMEINPTNVTTMSERESWVRKIPRSGADEYSYPQIRDEQIAT
jgi:hypothetical protein